MRTARLLPVSPRMHFSQGVPAQGVYLPMAVYLPGGLYLPRGATCPGTPPCGQQTHVKK